MPTMGNLISISDNTTLIGADPPATVRAPEIEAGVGCDFDSYLLVPDNTLDDRIAAAKARLRNDVVILGHHYQRDEVVKFADFRGDSLKLSYQAAEAQGRYIVFCGVHFMAESADIFHRRDQGLHRRAGRLDLHQFERRRRHEVGLRARRESALSSRRASWPQHRLSHGHFTRADDRLGSLSGIWRQYAGSHPQRAYRPLERLLFGAPALHPAASRACPA